MTTVHEAMQILEDAVEQEEQKAFNLAEICGAIISLAQHHIQDHGSDKSKAVFTKLVEAYIPRAKETLWLDDDAEILSDESPEDEPDYMDWIEEIADRMKNAQS